MAHILTSSQYSELLSDEAQARSDVDVLVEKAEMKLIDRYREVRPAHSLEYLSGDLDLVNDDVQLDGWITDSNGDPDVAAMDDDLVRRLRLEIAGLVNHWVDVPDDYVGEIKQGDRRVQYREVDDVPDDFGAMLRRYDERDVWH